MHRTTRIACSLLALAPVALTSPTLPQRCGDCFGVAFCRTPDLNGDGIDELAVADPDRERVLVVDPCTGELLESASTAGLPILGPFGRRARPGLPGLSDPPGVARLRHERTWETPSQPGQTTNHRFVLEDLERGSVRWAYSCNSIRDPRCTYPGDLDGDGAADVVLVHDATCVSDCPGIRATALSGATGEVLHEITLPGRGRWIDLVGLENGDGTSDYAILRWHLEDDAVTASSTTIFTSAGAKRHEIRRPSTDDFADSPRLHAWVDVDGDGRRELAIADEEPSWEWRVTVYSPLSGQPLYEVEPPFPSHIMAGKSRDSSTLDEDFGNHSVWLDDVDGDGVQDLAVGSNLEENCCYGEYVAVVSGATGAFIHLVLRKDYP